VISCTPESCWRVTVTLDHSIDVLIVEDNQAVRNSWTAILQSAGWKVAEAPDGFVALDLLLTAPVGAMVLDVRMPVLDGFGLLDRLEDPPPVVLVPATSYDTEVSARRQKIHSCLVKPVAPERLIAAVASALDVSKKLSTACGVDRSEGAQDQG